MIIIPTCVEKGRLDVERGTTPTSLCCFFSSKFPQTTHLTFGFPPPGPGFFVKTTLEGITSNLLPPSAAFCFISSLVQQRVYLALCGLIPRLPISVPLERRYDLRLEYFIFLPWLLSKIPQLPVTFSSSLTIFSSSSNVHHFFFDHLGNSHAILLSISSFFNQGSEHRMCLLTESPPSSQSIFKLLLRSMWLR